jgi:hypothetical protein
MLIILRVHTRQHRTAKSTILYPLALIRKSLGQDGISLKIPITRQRRPELTTFRTQRRGAYKAKRCINFRGEILINDTNLYKIKTYLVFLLRPIFFLQVKVISIKVKKKHKTYLICTTDNYKVSYARRYIFTYRIHIDAIQIKDPEMFTTGCTKIFLHRLLSVQLH